VNRRTLAAVSVIVAAAAGALAYALEAVGMQPEPHGHILDTSFRSRALDGRLALVVYEPPGYSRGDRR
jgi:hypothetical protein